MTARSDALEEAAKLCEEDRARCAKNASMLDRGCIDRRIWEARSNQCDALASAIRALRRETGTEER